MNLIIFILNIIYLNINKNYINFIKLNIVSIIIKCITNNGFNNLLLKLIIKRNIKYIINKLNYKNIRILIFIKKNNIILIGQSKNIFNIYIFEYILNKKFKNFYIFNFIRCKNSLNIKSKSEDLLLTIGLYKNLIINNKYVKFYIDNKEIYIDKNFNKNNIKNIIKKFNNKLIIIFI